MSRKKHILTQELLRKLLSYDESAGNFTWLPREPHLFKTEGQRTKWNTQYAGKSALIAFDARGYKVGGVLGNMVKAHRVAWLWTYGVTPETIDHINGDKSDNRILNLRNVSHAVNCRNTAKPRTNTSGASGVKREGKKWRAVITTCGKNHHLGLYPNFDDAVEARNRAKESFGFHENHGR